MGLRKKPYKSKPASRMTMREHMALELACSQLVNPKREFCKDYALLMAEAVGFADDLIKKLEETDENIKSS